MLKKVLATAGLATAALAMASAPSFAIADADGAALSAQGDGGTNHTGTHGDHSPSFDLLNNANVCLPRIDHVQVGLVDVNAEIPVLDQQHEQVCNVGQTTQTDGDAPLSHLIG
jgi:opacity protein-like surface antigen